MTPARMRRIKEYRRRQEEQKFKAKKNKLMAYMFITFAVYLLVINFYLAEKACQTYKLFC